MDDLPATVIHPDAFRRNRSAGNDGVFDWSWTDGCFGETKITPMDVDGFVERRGQFLVFETKDPGVEIKWGQRKSLAELHFDGNKTLFLVWGKMTFESGIIVPSHEWVRFSPGIAGQKYHNVPSVVAAQNWCTTWYAFANSQRHVLPEEYKNWPPFNLGYNDDGSPR